MALKNKTCRVCEKKRLIKFFYKHPTCVDGYLYECKDCVKNRVREYRDNNLERIREYDRNRPNLDERIKNSRYYTNKRKEEDPEYRKLIMEKNKQWRKDNRIKANAQQRLRRHVKQGKIKKPKQCIKCNKKAKVIEGHHEDYSKPLDVVWLCVYCHRARHKEINEERRKNEANRKTK